MSPVPRRAAHTAEGRKGKGEDEPSQEAPGPRPSLDPQPRVSEHLGSAGPAQPPCGGNRPATGLRRRKEGGGGSPGVLCNQHLENSWKEEEEEEECVLVVHMCVFSRSDVSDLSFVCFRALV